MYFFSFKLKNNIYYKKYFFLIKFIYINVINSGQVEYLYS